MAADRKQLEDLTKELKKNNDNLSGVDKAFSSFSDDFKAYTASAANVTDGLANFLDMREDSLAGFGRELTASFRATQKWADRIKFDISTFADENIRDVNEGIEAFEDMQSETGKSFEKRMGGLMENLRKADQGEAIAILQNIHAMREEAHKSLSEEEAERLDFMAKTASRGLESISNNTSILKGAIMETLPSLDKFAESVLGGGILGKFAGTVIRKKRQAREAQATAQGMSAAGGQQDAKMAAQSSALANASEGGKELALQLSQQSIIGELREINKHNRKVLGLEQSQLEQQKKQTEGALSSKENESEALAVDERQHDETVAALKAGGGGEDDGDCPKIPGGFMDAVLGALSGKWIAQAATFLMTPLKKVVGAVAGGVGKAVGFIMPKKWSAGLSKFFKTTDSGAASSIGKASKSAGFITKLTDKFKGIIKSLVDTLKTIFKSIGEVINNIAKSVGKVIKSIGKGIADMMKQLARGIGYFGKKNVLLGAAALGIVAGGIFLFSKAMVEFTKVTWKAVGVAAVSILLLVGTLTALGALMMSGIGAVAIIAGAAALVIVAGAMWVLGKAMQEFGKAADDFMPVFELIGEVLVRLAKVAMPAFMIVAQGFSDLMVSFGKTVLAVVTGIKEVFLGLFTLIPNILQSVGDIISTIGDVIVNVITAIGNVIGNVLEGVVSTFERFGAAGLATGIAGTAVSIGVLSAAILAFAAASAGGKVLGSIGNVIGGFLSLFGGGSPPTALEIIAALSTMEPGSLVKIPKLIDDISASLARFGGIEVDTDGAENAIWIIAEIADELGDDDVLTALSRLSRIDMSKFADGLLSLFSITKLGEQDVGNLFSMLNKTFDFLDIIPAKLVDEKAEAFNRLATSIGNVADEMIKLDGVDMDNAGYALQLAQQQNIETKERAWYDLPGKMQDALDLQQQQRQQAATIQAPMQISSNNSQHFHGNINARNPDTSLNNLLSRRR